MVTNLKNTLINYANSVQIWFYVVFYNKALQILFRVFRDLGYILGKKPILNRKFKELGF